MGTQKGSAEEEDRKAEQNKDTLHRGMEEEVADLDEWGDAVDNDRVGQDELFADVVQVGEVELGRLPFSVGHTSQGERGSGHDNPYNLLLKA